MMRRLIVVLCCASVLLACGTPDSAVPPTVHPTTGQGAYPTPSAIVAAPTPVPTPTAPLPSVEETPSAESPSVQPIALTPTSVILSEEQPTWGTIVLSTILTDGDHLQSRYTLFAWSPITPEFLLSRDKTLFILNIENNEWTEIAAHVITAVWSPTGDTVAFITEDSTQKEKTYALWTWSANDGPMLLTPITHMVNPIPEISWGEPHRIAITTRTGVVAYDLESEKVHEILVFQAPNSYVRTSPGFEDIMEPNASIGLAPDGIHGIVTDNNGTLSFFEGEKIIATTMISETTGFIWSHDSKKVILRIHAEQISVFNNQGILQYILEGENMHNLTPHTWSGDNSLIIYSYNGAGTSFYNSSIAKIDSKGGIELFNGEEMNGYVRYAIWSPNNDYIAYDISRQVDDNWENIFLVNLFELK